MLPKVGVRRLPRENITASLANDYSEELDFTEIFSLLGRCSSPWQER